MSFERQKSLTISIEDPLVKSDRTLHYQLTEQVERYQHEIRAIGGFYSANITINDRQDKIEDWVEDGRLGRHVITYNPELEVIWEGFVNRIRASLGPLQITIGPLLNIGNRIRVIYSTIDNTVEPPVIGNRVTTATASNTDSQALYGIIDKVVSISGASTTEAEQLRDTFLNDPKRAFPPTSRKSNLSSSGDPSVRIDCLGYWHWLNTYVYNNTGVTGDQNLSAKLIAVRDAEPNTGIFSSDDSRVTTNTTQVTQYENDNKTGLVLMKRLNTLGDSSFNRYNIGFYAGRQLVYEVAPTDIAYEQRIAGNRGITDRLGAMIDPWNVVSAKFLFYPDFLVGRLPPVTADTLSSDPRVGYLEMVKFDTPYGLSASGEQLGETDQLLARLGLGGFGA